MTRIAVLADTHAVGPLAGAWLERVHACDLVVHAGDFVAADTLRSLEELGMPVIAVHGNNDAPELVRRLPERTIVRSNGVAIGLVHDAGPARGRLARLRRWFPDADAVIYGHSHIPLHETDGEGFQIFNPGSPTVRRRHPDRTLGIARVARKRVVFEHVIVEDAPASARASGW